MHWSVGMLLHAVCVFFFKGERNSLKKWPGCFPARFLASMVLFDLYDIPFMPFS